MISIDERTARALYDAGYMSAAEFERRFPSIEPQAGRSALLPSDRRRPAGNLARGEKSFPAFPFREVK